MKRLIARGRMLFRASRKSPTKIPKRRYIDARIKSLHQTKNREEIHRLLNELLQAPHAVAKQPGIFAQMLESNKHAFEIFVNEGFATRFIWELKQHNREFFKALSPEGFRTILNKLNNDISGLSTRRESHLLSLFIEGSVLKGLKKPSRKLYGFYIIQGMNKRKAEAMAKMLIDYYRIDYQRKHNSIPLQNFLEFFRRLTKHGLLDEFISDMGSNVGHFRKTLTKDTKVAKLLARTIAEEGGSIKSIKTLTGVEITKTPDVQFEVAKNLFYKGLPEAVIETRTGMPIEKLKDELGRRTYMVALNDLDRWSKGTKRLFAGFRPQSFRANGYHYVVIFGHDAHESNAALGIFKVRNAREFVWNKTAPDFRETNNPEKVPLGRVKIVVEGGVKGRPNVLIRAIQGGTNVSRDLKRFSEIVGMPWATYLGKIILEQARKNRFYGVGLITPPAQEFLEALPKHQLHKAHALYGGTARALGFGKRKIVLKGIEYYFKKL
jgi:hypothetical protein